MIYEIKLSKQSDRDLRENFEYIAFDLQSPTDLFIYIKSYNIDFKRKVLNYNPNYQFMRILQMLLKKYPDKTTKLKCLVFVRIFLFCTMYSKFLGNISIFGHLLCSLVYSILYTSICPVYIHHT